MEVTGSWPILPNIPGKNLKNVQLVKLYQDLLDHGIHLAFGERVVEICGSGKVEEVVTDKGVYPADMVVLCIGFKPNTNLSGERVERFKIGAYLVNKKQETSVKDVYAIGDCAFKDLQKPELMKSENPPDKIRIVYDADSRVVLGTQMASAYDISMGIHLFSLAVQEKVTIEKLALTDILFLPHFTKPYNYITMAAISAK